MGKKQFYVIDVSRKYCCHQGDKPSCEEYIHTCIDMWHRQADEFRIAEGAADLKKQLKEIGG